jgi:hypothetical protein
MVANIIRTTATGAAPRLTALEVVVARGEDVVPPAVPVPVAVGVAVGAELDAPNWEAEDETTVG